MSLVAWWPLDGDAKDRVGGNNGSGSPTYVDGKIGQGIDGDGSQIRVSSESESIKSAFTGNQMTLSVWLRQYDHNTYRWSDILGMDGTRLERGRGDNGNPAGDYWCNLGTGDSAISGRENNVFNSDIGQLGNEWFHLLIRRAGDDYAVYINGNRDTSCPVTGPMEISGDFIINEDTAGVEIDDVRLYDHAISEKKIQKLSQAKVLHYKFNDIGTITYEWYTHSLNHPSSESEFDDFFDGAVSGVTLEGSGPWDRTINWGSGGQSTGIDSVGSKPEYLPAGNYSWKVDGVLYAPESGTYTFGVDGDDAVDVIIDGQNVANFYGGHGFDGDYGHNGTIDLDEGYYSFKARQEEAGGGDGISVAWKKPSESSWSYIGEQYLRGNQVVTDASGHGNVGALNGPSYTENNVVGSGAYEFDNENSDGSPYEHIASIDDVYVPTKFTLCAWLKDDNSAGVGDNIYSVGWHRLCFNGGDSDHTGMIFYKTDNNYSQPTVSGIGMDDGNWHHHCMVVDSKAETIKIHFDGELIDTQSTGDMRDVGSYREFIVGSAWSKTYGGWDGNIDDVRVYASTLSKSEVQEIYEQRASIDSGGNFHSHELSEIVESGIELEAFSRGNNS